jgi:hypothetical protein
LSKASSVTKNIIALAISLTNILNL